MVCLLSRVKPSCISRIRCGETCKRMMFIWPQNPKHERVNTSRSSAIFLFTSKIVCRLSTWNPIIESWCFRKLFSRRKNVGNNLVGTWTSISHCSLRVFTHSWCMVESRYTSRLLILPKVGKTRIRATTFAYWRQGLHFTTSFRTLRSQIWFFLELSLSVFLMRLTKGWTGWSPLSWPLSSILSLSVSFPQHLDYQTLGQMWAWQAMHCNEKKDHLQRHLQPTKLGLVTTAAACENDVAWRRH